MTWGDILWLFLRWLHALAAVAWVGSALFYALVIEPNLRGQDSILRRAKDNGGSAEPRQSIVGEWRELLEIAAFVLLISGVLLAFNRISQPRIGATYAIILGIKVVLVAIMPIVGFRGIARHERGAQTFLRLRSSARLMAGLGAVVILLAILLRQTYEKSLVP